MKGGGDIHFRYVKGELRKKKEVSVETYNSLRLDYYSVTSLLYSSIRNFFFCEKNKIIKGEKIDLILCESPYPHQAALGIRLFLLTKVPTIIYFHHIFSITFFPFRRGFFRSLTYFIYNSILLCITKILGIAVSVDNPSTLRIKGIRPIANHDAIPSKEQYISAEHTASKTFDLCYVGRFQKHKGSDDLIECINLLKKKGYNLSVAIIGNINQNELKKISRKLNKRDLSSNFKFFGWVDHKTKISIMRKSKFFVSLSYEEGWGLAVMEAAALGIPVIAYRLPAYDYLRNNYISITIGKIQEASSTILNAIKNEDTFWDNADKARELVLKYNYTDIVDKQLMEFKGLSNINSIKVN